MLANIDSAMNSTRATFLYSAPFVAVGMFGAYSQGIRIGLLSLALTLPAGTLAFWFGARRARHKWYSAVVSGALTMVVAMQTLQVAKLVLSPWLQLLAIEVVIAAVGFWLGRRPPFPATTTRPAPESDRLG